ncbi:hypothetical protein Acidovoranil_01030 [Acidovorax sp. FG27]
MRSRCCGPSDRMGTETPNDEDEEAADDEAEDMDSLRCASGARSPLRQACQQVRIQSGKDSMMAAILGFSLVWRSIVSGRAGGVARARNTHRIRLHRPIHMGLALLNI